MIPLSDIRNEIDGVVFDLGGVLYRIDHARTHKALSEIFGTEPDFSFTSQAPVFRDYETGHISTDQFFESLRSLFQAHPSNAEIAGAWNSMLLGLYPDAAKLVATLGANIPLALLSNINDLHHRAVDAECAEIFKTFDRLFLSYEMGLRKPDTSIYERVLSELGWRAERTIFVEDTPANCRAAEQLGMKVIQIEQNLRDRQMLELLGLWESVR